MEAIGNSIVRLSQFLFVCQPLPAEEEKELKETLQDIIGQGKKVNLEQMVTNFPAQILNHTVIH